MEGFIIRKMNTKKKTICLKIRKNYTTEVHIFVLISDAKNGLIPHNGKEILSIQHILSKEKENPTLSCDTI